jgi:murein DD-endopeptidase MepM/ murein hydrolase activator NlpD
MLVGLAEFTRLFASANSLDIARWRFDPGMRHGDAAAWWGEKAPRREVHHGLDFARYEAPDGEVWTLRPGMHVPLSGKGAIVGIMKDFLGLTVVCAHEEQEGRVFISLYGHVRPVEGILAETLEAGSIIAELSHPGAGDVPAHLHLGLALVPMGRDLGTLSWEYLNTSSDVVHIDPLSLMR